MLLNLKSQKSSPFHTDMDNKYWEDDKRMQSWHDKIHEMEQTSIINIPNMKGSHFSGLNPDIWLESKFEYNDFPAYVELPKPRDKRNRKFNILLGSGYSSFLLCLIKNIRNYLIKNRKLFVKNLILNSI